MSAAEAVPEASPTELTLGTEDLRWYQNLVLKETLIKKNNQDAQKGAQDAMLKVAQEAEEMMNSFSDREGVDLRKYDINWETGAAKLKKPRPSKEDAT